MSHKTTAKTETNKNQIPPKPQLEGIIKPIVKFEGHKNPLEAIFEGDPSQLPVLKSVGMVKLGKNRSSWVSFVMTSKGKEILSIEVTEPDVRLVTENNCKTSFVETFVDNDGGAI